jgi:hypothetical protein
VRISQKQLYVHGYSCPFILTVFIQKPDDGPIGPKHVVTYNHIKYTAVLDGNLPGLSSERQICLST